MAASRSPYRMERNMEKELIDRAESIHEELVQLRDSL
jgi:hypothetical protein